MEIHGPSEVEILNTDENSISNNFYSKYGHEGLSKQAEAQVRNADLSFIKKFVHRKDTILELGCGYGRVLTELLKEGYHISGLDLNTDLLEEAKRILSKNNLQTTLVNACMSKTGFADNSFDKIICIWSSFNHILTEKKQIDVLNEIHRILAPGGQALIEVIDGSRKKPKELVEKKGFGEDKRLIKLSGKEIFTVIYMHTKETLSEICRKSKIDNWKVKFLYLNSTRHLSVIIKK